MVEVGDRPASRREAEAEGLIAMAPQTLALVLAGAAPKGNVLAVARVAAIQAAKRTWELIPLCHPIALSGLVVATDGALLARVSGSQASSRIGSLAAADLLLEIPAELGALEAGTELWAQLLRLPIL